MRALGAFKVRMQFYGKCVELLVGLSRICAVVKPNARS